MPWCLTVSSPKASSCIRKTRPKPTVRLGEKQRSSMGEIRRARSTSSTPSKPHLGAEEATRVYLSKDVQRVYISSFQKDTNDTAIVKLVKKLFQIYPGMLAATYWRLGHVASSSSRTKHEWYGSQRPSCFKSCASLETWSNRIFQRSTDHYWPNKKVTKPASRRLKYAKKELSDAVSSGSTKISRWMAEGWVMFFGCFRDGSFMSFLTCYW